MRSHRAAAFVLVPLWSVVVACGSSSPGDTEGAGAGAGSPAGAGPGSGPGGGSGSGASSSAGSGGTPSFEGYTRVDRGDGAALTGGVDLAISPGGAIYVSWVDEQNGGDVFVARSVDGGATFGAAVQVDDDVVAPIVSMARHPYVVADDDRVAVVFNDEPGNVYLYVSSARGALSFGSPTIVGGDVATDFRDFPKAIFLADGTLAIAFHGYPESGARIFVARESAGFASQPATGGAPGVPCECCPIDLVQASSGDVMLAFRNNDDDVRDMWLASAPSGGAFSAWAPISTSEGFVDACPMQGPRLVQTAAKKAFAVWSGRGAENAGLVHAATSSDGGGSWSGGASLGFVGDEPTVAIGASGRLFVTGVTGSGASAMVQSDDGGASFGDAEALETPDGALGVPQAESAAGVAGLAGASEAGSVWFRRME
jgi:hypothetical protein